MGTVLHEQPDQIRVQAGQVRVRRIAVAGRHHRDATVQRVRAVLGVELRVGLLADGVGPHVRLVVLELPQKGRSVFHAHDIRSQDDKVRIMCTRFSANNFYKAGS